MEIVALDLILFIIQLLLQLCPIVKISKTPGCTQIVNYFALQNPGKASVAYLIDLPGYGFARAPKSESEKWKNTITSYLGTRDFLTMRYSKELLNLFSTVFLCDILLYFIPCFRRVFVLIDSRRGMMEVDKPILDILNDLALPYQVSN